MRGLLKISRFGDGARKRVLRALFRLHSLQRRRDKSLESTLSRRDLMAHGAGCMCAKGPGYANSGSRAVSQRASKRARAGGMKGNGQGRRFHAGRAPRRGRRPEL